MALDSGPLGQWCSPSPGCIFSNSISRSLPASAVSSSAPSSLQCDWPQWSHCICLEHREDPLEKRRQPLLPLSGWEASRLAALDGWGAPRCSSFGGLRGLVFMWPNPPRLYSGVHPTWVFIWEEIRPELNANTGKGVFISVSRTRLPQGQRAYLERWRGLSASRHPTSPVSGFPQLPSEVHGELLK